MKVSAQKLWSIVGYDPHPKQALFHEAKSRFKVAGSGRRFGKSKMAAMDKLPKLFDPPHSWRGWIVADSYGNGEDEFQYMWDAVTILKKEFHIKPKAEAYNLRTGEMYIEMPWGAKVEVKSAQYLTSLVGKGLGWAILAEAAKLAKVVWEKHISPALADHRAPADFVSTPEGDNWFKELHDQGQDPDNHFENGCPWESSIESWNFPSWENPVVYPGGFDDPEVQRQLRTPDDPVFWQEIGASMEGLQGKIYHEFDEKIHVKTHEYRPDWPDFLWFDFGYSISPFVCLDVQMSPSEDLFVWREWYEYRKAPHEAVAELRERRNPEGYRPRVGYGDSADPGAIETISRNWVGTIGDPEAKDFLTGVGEVKAKLKDMGGVAHLFFDPSCTNCRREFRNYKMPKSRTMEDVPNEAKKPRSKVDHTPDAVRYGLMHMFRLGYTFPMEDVLIGSAGDENPIESRTSEPQTFFTMDKVL